VTSRARIGFHGITILNGIRFEVPYKCILGRVINKECNSV